MDSSATRRYLIASRIKIVPLTLAPQTMNLRNKVLNQWPLAIVGLGLMLSVAWLALLAWLALHFLKVV
jgi:hypothetical protein